MAVMVEAARMSNPQYLYGNRYPVAKDGKRTRRRGLVLPRGFSIATPGFDPESRVFIFRHCLATQLKHAPAHERGRWTPVATGVAVGGANVDWFCPLNRPRNFLGFSS